MRTDSARAAVSVASAITSAVLRRIVDDTIYLTMTFLGGREMAILVKRIN